MATTHSHATECETAACRHRLQTSDELLTHKELAILMGRSTGNPLVHLAGWILRRKALNAIYRQCASHTHSEFVSRFLKSLSIDVGIAQGGLENIPENGPVVIVANHPLGALDGMALIATVIQRRKDVKVLANSILQRVEPLQDILIRVDPFGSPTSAQDNVPGIRETLRHLQHGGVLLVFPAGEVSPNMREGTGPIDSRWDSSIMKIIQRTKATVVPVFISGQNSKTFYRLGSIHPRLRTLLLPVELLRKRNSSLNLVIGRAPHSDIVHAQLSPEDLGEFLRSLVYCLAPRIASIGSNNESVSPMQPPVAMGPSGNALSREIQALAASCIVSQGDFDVFLMHRDESPNVLLEIGRLREQTFREVGEGTGTSLDIDHFDRLYDHLVLWHRPSKQVAGSYRLGHGDRLLREVGSDGLYSTTLFEFDSIGFEQLRKCLELGRSFVRREFQRQRLPLHLLWIGILRYILDHPELTMIIGSVSVSGRYSQVSKELIKMFFTNQAVVTPFTGHVHPRNPLQTNSEVSTITNLLMPVGDSIRRLDRLLTAIEPDGACCPILLKKYAQQNARIVAFNVDNAFSDSMDGFMVLSVDELRQELRDTVTERLKLE